MELSDVVFLKSVTPITIIDNPSKRTKEAVLKLMRNEGFEEWLTTVRKQLGLNEMGIDIKTLEGKSLLDPNEAPSTFGLFLNMFPKQKINEYGFADDFMLNFGLFIFFNAFIALEYYEGLIERDFEFVPTKALTAFKLHSYKNEVGAILIPYQCSKHKLIKWINKNWEKMDKEMDEHLFETSGILELHKNTEIADEIDQLYKKGTSYSEISTILTDKYQDDKRLADSDHIRKIHIRYKQELEIFSKKINSGQ